MSTKLRFIAGDAIHGQLEVVSDVAGRVGDGTLKRLVVVALNDTDGVEIWTDAGDPNEALGVITRGVLLFQVMPAHDIGEDDGGAS
jgi:hypothetical protein